MLEDIYPAGSVSGLIVPINKPLLPSMRPQRWGLRDVVRTLIQIFHDCYSMVCTYPREPALSRLAASFADII